MKRMPYTQITKEALPARNTVLGFVKVGGIQDKVRFTRDGRPWAAPERYVDPVRFAVTTRQQDIREVKGRGPKASETFKVGMGYVRDDRIHTEVGGAPDELDIRLMFPHWADNFVCHFGAHNGKKWVCQGNGQEASDIQRGDGIPCPCPRLSQFEGKYEGPPPPEDARRLVPCKPRGVLSMILPAAETFGGFHVYKTTSWESIANLRTQLELFEAQFGRVDGIPFRLKVYPATKGYGDGEGTTTQPIVTLVIAASFDTARQIAASAAEESRRYLLAAGGAPDPEQHRRLLEQEMVEEAEAEGQEFHPDAGKPREPSNEDLTAQIKARAQGTVNGNGQPLPVVQPAPEQEPPTVDAEWEEEGEWEEPEDAQDAPPPAGNTAAPDADQAVGRPAEEEPEPAPDPNEPRGSLTGKTRGELAEAYVEAIREHAPHLEDDGARRVWQAQQVGKSSAATWDLDDFELAITLLRKGRTETENAQTSMPGV